LIKSNNASANGIVESVVEKTRKVITLQLVMMLLVSIVFYAWFYDSGQSLQMVLAVGYGGSIIVISTLLLGFGVKRASDGALDNPGKSTIILYAGAAQRFIFVLAAFAFGLAWLKLSPAGLFAGFGSAQLAYILSLAVFERRRR